MGAAPASCNQRRARVRHAFLSHRNLSASNRETQANRSRVLRVDTATIRCAKLFGMITRRNLLLGLTITILPMAIGANQGEKPRGPEANSRTVTLTIEGMT